MDTGLNVAPDFSRACVNVRIRGRDETTIEEQVGCHLPEATLQGNCSRLQTSATLIIALVLESNFQK